MKDLSRLMPVKPDQGKAQWVEGKVAGIARNEPERNYHVRALRRRLAQSMTTWSTRTLMIGSVVLLTACGLSGPFPGVPDLHDPRRMPHTQVEIAAPQVAYRIDENRYFELVPYGSGACTRAMVHFVDIAKGIRSEVVRFDWGPMVEANLIIDASNDQYLVAPVTRGNINCSSGGGLCGGSKLPYSTDGGRTWKRADPMFSGDDIYLSGDDVYVSADGRSEQTAKLSGRPEATQSWSPFDSLKTPPAAPRKQPLDTKFHCTVNGKE